MAAHAAVLRDGSCSIWQLGSDLKHVTLYFWHNFLHMWKWLLLSFVITLGVALWGIRPFESGFNQALGECFSGASWKSVSEWLSWSGEWLYHVFPVVGIWILGTLLRSRRLQVLATCVLIAIVFASVTVRVGKISFGRLRPIVVERYDMSDTFVGPTLRARKFTFPQGEINATKFESFPSGHTAAAYATSTPIQLAHPLIGIPWTAYSTFIAFSRTYNNQHYPSDLFAGLVLGVVCSWPTRRLMKQIKQAT